MAAAAQNWSMSRLPFPFPLSPSLPVLVTCVGLQACSDPIALKFRKKSKMMERESGILFIVFSKPRENTFGGKHLDEFLTPYLGQFLQQCDDQFSQKLKTDLAAKCRVKSRPESSTIPLCSHSFHTSALLPNTPRFYISNTKRKKITDAEISY